MIEELQKLAPLLAGPICGILVLVAVAYFQRKDCEGMKKVIEKKDDEIKSIAKDSIAAITALSISGQTTAQWQTRVEEKIDKVLTK